MKVSCDAKHATNRKAKKFWDEVSIVFEELVATTNKLNESHSEFVLLKLVMVPSLCAIVVQDNYSQLFTSLQASYTAIPPHQEK